MARVCIRCGRAPSAQSKRKLLRGNYNPTARRMKRPNLQWARLPKELAAKWHLPAGRKVRLCAKCIKTIGHVTHGA